MSWQEILIQLQNLRGLNEHEELIVGDLIELFKKKNFVRFTNFNVDKEIINIEEVWKFDFEIPSIPFLFAEGDRIYENRQWFFI